MRAMANCDRHSFRSFHWSARIWKHRSSSLRRRSSPSGLLGPLPNHPLLLIHPPVRMRRKKKVSTWSWRTSTSFTSLRCARRPQRRTRMQRRGKKKLKVKVKDESKKSSSPTTPSSASTLRIFPDRLCFCQLPHTWSVKPIGVMRVTRRPLLPMHSRHDSTTELECLAEKKSTLIRAQQPVQRTRRSRSTIRRLHDVWTLFRNECDGAKAVKWSIAKSRESPSPSLDVSHRPHPRAHRATMADATEVGGTTQRSHVQPITS
jgi:hypothetical protein